LSFNQCLLSYINNHITYFKLLLEKILPNEPGLTIKHSTKEINQAVKQLFD